MIPLGILGSAHRAASSGAVLAYSVAATRDGSGTVTGSGPYIVTITGVALGDPAPDRALIIAYAAKGTGSVAPTALSIDSQPVALDATSADRYGFAIGHIAAPAGTTATVTATISQNVSNYSLVVYRVTGGAVSVMDTDIHTADTATINLAPQAAAGGLVVAVAYNRYGGVYSWAGANEDYAPFSSFGSISTPEAGPVPIAVTMAASGQNAQGLAVAYKGA